MKKFKRLTEEKFEDEKTKKALAMLMKFYRDEKFKLPKNKFSEALMTEVEKIDPEHKMSEREIVDMLPLKLYLEVSKNLKPEKIVSDEVLREYAQRHYETFKMVVTDTTPKSWDAMEYQSQQLMVVLGLENAKKFIEYVKEIMDADSNCPYLLRKIYDVMDVEEQKFPTVEDEKLAEEIIGLACPKLERKNEDVFRALVDSLKWRGTKELNKTLEAVKKTPKEKRKLRGRESCIFIESDEGVHHVG